MASRSPTRTALRGSTRWPKPSACGRDTGRSAILACSALRESYRETLRVGPAVRFVYLKADAETIRQRLARRRGHFFDAGLLASQFGALEEPKDALVVDVAGPREDTVLAIKKGLGISSEKG